MKLYLVRKYQKYIGPITLKELISAYEKMEINLGDYIATSLKKWVCMDDSKGLQENYPEVYNALYTDKNVDEPASNYKPKLWRATPYFGIIIGILIFVATFIYLLVPDMITNNFKFKTEENLPVLSIALDYVKKDNLQALETYLSNYEDEMIKRIINSRQMYNEWIPILRYIAFNKDGYIKGLSFKLLKGFGATNAPLDCSLTTWKDRFILNINKVYDIFSRKTVLMDDWINVFLWDPYWIKRRNNVKGWIKPANYYTACMMMAYKALEHVLATNSLAINQDKSTIEEISKDNKTTKQQPNYHEFAQSLLARLRYMLNIINNTEYEAINDQINYNIHNIIFILNCLEQPNTNNADALEACIDKDIYESLTDEWKGFFYQRKIKNTIRVLLQNKDVLSDKDLQILSKLSQDITTEEPVTNLDYSPEQKYLLSLILYNGSFKEAQKRVKYEFSEIDFNL